MVMKTIEEVKQRKNYYRNTYRTLMSLNYYSLLVSCFLILVVAYKYFAMPESDYYSTNSASAIMPLAKMMEPNYSKKALLRPDIPEEMGSKSINI